MAERCIKCGDEVEGEGECALCRGYKPLLGPLGSEDAPMCLDFKPGHVTGMLDDGTVTDILTGTWERFFIEGVEVSSVDYAKARPGSWRMETETVKSIVVKTESESGAPTTTYDFIREMVVGKLSQPERLALYKWLGDAFGCRRDG